jgi:hypothetical protein
MKMVESTGGHSIASEKSDIHKTNNKSIDCLDGRLELQQGIKSGPVLIQEPFFGEYLCEPFKK